MTQYFLHIGMNKTGSTALQVFFSENQRALKKNGTLYPDTGRTESVKHQDLVEALGFSVGPQRDPQDHALRQKLRADLLAEAGACNAKRVVISSEMFSRKRNLRPVQAFFQDLDLQVVVYVRRHDHWWASNYAQAVKTTASPPWGPGFAAFWQHATKKANRHATYSSLIDAWAKMFGRDRITVRPYEPVQLPNGIVADFMGIAGIEPTGFKTDLRKNPSLSQAGLTQIDRLQRRRIPGFIRTRLIAKAVLTDQISTNGSFGADQIPPDIRAQVIDENLSDYAYIARTYLNRPDGRLFYEPMPEIN